MTLSEFTTWSTFPFTGDLKVKDLEPPVLPEPPRRDDPGGPPCKTCERDDGSYLWVDDDWRVSSTGKPTGLPPVLFLEPRQHHDLADLPPPLAAGLGPMIQRVEAALLSIGGIARVHVSRWGDGGAHLHLWFLTRPEGALQLRGTFLAVWDELIPPVPDERWRQTWPPSRPLWRRRAAGLSEGSSCRRNNLSWPACCS